MLAIILVLQFLLEVVLKIIICTSFGLYSYNILIGCNTIFMGHLSHAMLLPMPPTYYEEVCLDIRLLSVT